MPKIYRRRSSNTTFTTDQPSSPGVAENFMNFRFNHLTQRAVRPNRLGCASEGFTTPNADGQTVAANAGTGQALGGGGMTNPVNDKGATKV